MPGEQMSCEFEVEAIERILVVELIAREKTEGFYDLIARSASGNEVDTDARRQVVADLVHQVFRQMEDYCFSTGLPESCVRLLRSDEIDMKRFSREVMAVRQMDIHLRIRMAMFRQRPPRLSP